MEKTLDFSDLLRLIDERSTAFRAAIAAAPDLDAQVPTCPEWTLLDLVQHLGEGRRAWAATVAAGPDAVAKAECEDAPPAPRERQAMLDWLAASTQELLDALREAGPDRGCWTWWGASQSPRTCGAVARHQLQQIAVHTYDAQLTVGTPQPLPDEVALDGIEEFLFTCNATPSPWPHKPTTIDYHATEGRSWRLTVDGDGARSTRIPAPTARGALEAAGLSVSGKAGELVLALYDRIGLESLEVSGDREIFDQLIAWEPEE
ncbi:maleylpyruvate isomerase family mycothiol-dependent enzyme [Streptomyces sp. NBC_00341]|uniref:maleylpyruvate isomerase N-terminal domain-containing protein n=1 Tax=Streptomyces sp. NBC_00341 TaxID=2975717 RepID=UPI00308E39E4|nr:maleylpyruvate isomerase family mycothiol-dependent enzyme [Streptomyces sp. NBC_00341]